MNRLGPFNITQLDAAFHTRNNVNFNSSHCGSQGKVEGSFLSLGIGGTEEAATQLKMACARKALVSNEVGAHCTPKSGLRSTHYHILQMQQNDMNHHRVHVSNHHQDVNSGTSGGNNSAQILNSQQSGNPSWTMNHIPSGTSSIRQNYAGMQGNNPFLHTHMATQVSWVSSGQGVPDLPFPKRLGVEFNGRQIDSLQATGQSQTCHFPDNVVRHSFGLSTDRAPVHHPLNPQQSNYIKIAFGYNNCC
ncbi:hypothetical protein LXL04_031995 [Taraxacum kok-saghyz]